MKQKISIVALLAVLAALTAFGGVARPSVAAQATAAATTAAAQTDTEVIPGSGLVKGEDAKNSKIDRFRRNLPTEAVRCLVC